MVNGIKQGCGEGNGLRSGWSGSAKLGTGTPASTTGRGLSTKVVPEAGEAPGKLFTAITPLMGPKLLKQTFARIAVLGKVANPQSTLSVWPER